MTNSATNLGGYYLEGSLTYTKEDGHQVTNSAKWIKIWNIEFRDVYRLAFVHRDVSKFEKGYELCLPYFD